MESMTLEEAKERDFIGSPEVHVNPINGLETVCYRIHEPNDESSLNCEWSREYVLKK